jgi:hypothetical protein
VLALRSHGGAAQDRSVRWSGPDGIEVDLVEVTRDGRTRSYYRLRQWGRFVADVATIEQLARHVDLSRLVEAG